MKFLTPYLLSALASLSSLQAQTQTQTTPTQTENSALIPLPKIEDDSYDWYQRHQAILDCKNKIQPEIVLIGDSITHFWGGEPTTPNMPPRGGNTWQSLFKNKKVLNLGFGWDRTQNVLWRLQHGEFDGLSPKLIIVNIGTNNFSKSKARINTPSEITEAINEILKTLFKKSPSSKIILMGVFPRGFQANDPYRPQIQELNSLLQTKFAKNPVVTFLNLYNQFLQPDGSISNEIMNDSTHPTEKGYEIWAKALQPFLK